MAQLATHFSEFIESPNLSIVLNTEGLYFLLFDDKFRNTVEKGDLIFCDGIGLKLALNFSGVKNVQRLHGPDLFHKVLHQKHGKRQLIIGGTSRAHYLLLDKYPELKNDTNLKLYSEFVKEDELSELFEVIDDFQPDIIHVCLGIRKQEFIGTKIREKFPNCSIVGVGASIDFESGNVIRSSPFFQKIGFEWLPRLLREPRMLPRQTRALIGFLIYSTLGIFRIKKKNVNLLDIVNSNWSNR